MVLMNEVDYFNGRAQHYLQKADVAADGSLRQAFEAVARDFSAKAAAGDRKRELYLIDGLAQDF
jgi:ABC-type molybdate transport system substrate-binding protein